MGSEEDILLRNKQELFCGFRRRHFVKEQAGIILWVQKNTFCSGISRDYCVDSKEDILLRNNQGLFCGFRRRLFVKE